MDEHSERSVEELRRQLEGEAPALALLDAAPLCMALIDPETRLAWVNRAFARVAGPDPVALTGRLWGEVVQVLAGERPPGAGVGESLGALGPAEDRRVLEWRPWADVRPAGLALWAGRDVTAEHRTRVDLETTLQLLEGTFEASTVCIAYLDTNFDFLRVNQPYAEADNKTPEEFVGQNHFALYPNPENERIFAEVRETGVPYSALAKPFEYERSPERGVTHWDWTLTPVRDGEGRVTGLVLALRDVTDRIEAIEALQRSEANVVRRLEEKRVLLREVHHRVKNNLQVISSLLYLQSEKTQDPATRRLFQDSRDRVEAMFLVHEFLYQSEDLTRIEVGPYLDRLAYTIGVSHRRPDSAIEVEVEVADGVPPLGIEAAIPVGLIASELLANALRHAFPERSSGRARLVFEPADGELWLGVEDDGVGGLSPALLDSAETAGLPLVQALASQLRGTLEIGGGVEGARVGVRFPGEAWPSETRGRASAGRLVRGQEPGTGGASGRGQPRRRSSG